MLNPFLTRKKPILHRIFVLVLIMFISYSTSFSYYQIHSRFSCIRSFETESRKIIDIYHICVIIIVLDMQNDAIHFILLHFLFLLDPELLLVLFLFNIYDQKMLVGSLWNELENSLLISFFFWLKSLGHPFVHCWELSITRGI